MAYTFGGGGTLGAMAYAMQKGKTALEQMQQNRNKDLPQVGSTTRGALGSVRMASSAARMPSMATVSGPNTTATIGNGTTPQGASFPGKGFLTENIDTQYFNKEKYRNGMLSTFLGRDTKLASNVRRRNEMQNLIV